MPKTILINEFSDFIAGVYEEAERTMLAKVAKRLARGIDSPGWAEAKLAEVQALKQDIRTEIKALKAKSTELKGAIGGAYDGGSAVAERELPNVGTPITQLPPAMEALADEFTSAVQGTHLRILRATEDAYRGIVAQSSAQVVAGTQTLREAVQAGLNRFADQGITGFVDTKGRPWSLVSYTEMATRTATMNAFRQGHLDTLTANGYDLVIVSAHGNCCELCAKWEGKVLSLSGADTQYPSLAEARAAGLFHCNCRHVTRLYTPGLTQTPTIDYDPEAYAARQRQREIERQIRHWKNREVAATADPAEAQKAKAKVREWQAAQRRHIESANLAGEERHGEGWITLKRRSDRERSNRQWGME